MSLLLLFVLAAHAEDVPEAPEAEAPPVQAEAPPAEAPPVEAEAPPMAAAPAAPAPKRGLANMASHKPYAPVYLLGLTSGGGAVHETDVSRSGAGQFGFSAGYAPSDNLILSAGWDDRFYQQTYLSPTPDANTAAPLSEVRSQEHRQDLRIAFSADLLGLAGGALANHARLHASLAPRWVRYLHQTHGSWDGGVRAGLQLTLYPAERFHLLGGAGLGAPFFGASTTPSVMGTTALYSDLNAGLGVDFGETPRWTVDLAWVSDRVTFQHILRTMHTGTVTLGLAY